MRAKSLVLVCFVHLNNMPQVKKEWFKFKKLRRNELTMLKISLHWAIKCAASVWEKIRWAELVFQLKIVKFVSARCLTQTIENVLLIV